MKSLKNTLIFIGAWMVTATIILFTAAIISPKGPDGKAIVGDTYTVVVLIVPIVCGVLAVKKASSMVESAKVKKEQAFKSSVHGESFNVPRSAKMQNEMGKELIDSANTNLSIAYDSDSVSLFIHFYEKAIENFERAGKLDKVNYSVSPKWKAQNLKDEFQLHLCDAIVKSKKAVIDDICGKYKNSREFQEKALSDFQHSLKIVSPRFSDGTQEVADAAVADIQKMLSAKSAEEKRTSLIDNMSGEDFEAWCAELLRRHDYKNIEITPKSGDQGVDIIADKNDVKYAIQCKRYSSDLGNAPVQEVNAGKLFYHCHVGIVMTNRHFTQGGKDAADATGTLLWDRDKIFNMAKEVDML